MYHKVRQVRDQTPSESTRSVGKVDQLAVLRPLGLGSQDGFTKVPGSVGKQVGRERYRFDDGMLVELDVGRQYRLEKQDALVLLRKHLHQALHKVLVSKVGLHADQYSVSRWT